jgi:hypothetical protein
MAKLLITETIHSEKVQTVRLAAGTNTASAANTYTDKEAGKIVKLAGESRYVLAAAGDQIEGFITTVEGGRLDDYSWGGKVSTGVKEVTFDGDQATAGTGTLAIGDFVVAGTVVAAATALTAPVKVCKATIQPGTTETATVGDVNDHIKASRFQWRVVSLGSAGTGAVGTTGMIERV